MDIDLRLPSGDQKEDFDSNGVEGILVETKPHSSEDEIENNCEAISLVEEADCRVVELYREDGALEPLSGMEFESHGAAYAFYQEYARSVGFNTAIQNSRRSKTSKEFIDAKFACSRYGTKREYDKSMNRPRARQAKHDPETASGRRSISKTDCKASMHVKRRSDGKWVIHSFVKDHNHELLPAQAVSEQTRKIYAAMARQFAEYKNVVGLKNDSKSVFEKGRHAFDLGDCRMVLEFLTSMQSVNSNFFYAVDLGEDQSVKNLLWVDAKSRGDYSNFYDVVSFDTNYIRSKYKIPLAIFVGVNQHYQFMLLGCALLSDDSEGTYSWLMSTWVRAMSGLPPKVLITEQDKALKYVVSEVFPTTLHCYFLWNIIGKVTETLSNVMKQHDNFMEKFEKCVFRSSNEDEFGKRWCKILERFDLKENELMESLFEDREHWVPAYRRGTLLAGMCTADRSESVNSYFDKYVHKKTTLHEFAKQYEAIIIDRYDEEGKADSDTWNKAPVLKSPSPLEKSVSGTYTHAVFRKFQVEVLGVVACHPKAEIQDDTFVSFRVQDLEKQQDFSVTWNQLRCEVCCICRLFEYRGYLCRHALVVLQMCQQSSIPSHYVLKRWTKEAKNRNFFNGDCGQPSSRVQRYNELCHRALKLSEEASLSLESFTLALRSMEEVYGSCVSMNNSYKNVLENVASSGRCILAIDDDGQNRIASKPTKKKAPTKRRKVSSEDDVAPVGPEDSLQQMDKLNGFFGTQPSVSGMLNLMGPNRDAFYGDQQAMQGLGHLNTISTSHDGYYASHQTMSGLGQMDFFRSQTNFAYGIRDDGHVRTAQSHENASRHS